MTKKEKNIIREVIKEWDYDLENLELEQAEMLMFAIGEEVELGFSAEIRGRDTDYWLQVEYWSKKLGKSIIWQYSLILPTTPEGIIDYLERTQKEIKLFEKRIELKPL